MIWLRKCTFDYLQGMAISIIRCRLAARTLHRQIYLEVIPWIMYDIYVIRWPESNEGVCAFYRLPSKCNSKWRYCNQNGNGTTKKTIVYVYVYYTCFKRSFSANAKIVYFSATVVTIVQSQVKRHSLIESNRWNEITKVRVWRKFSVGVIVCQ